MTGNRKPSQSAMLKAYLEQHGSITPREALDNLGIMRLGARIFELKNDQGMPIRTGRETQINRYGAEVTYARYYLDAREERHGEGA